jgi:hypothetical protein
MRWSGAEQKPLARRLLKPVTNFLNVSRDADAADRHRELLMALQNPTLVHGYQDLCYLRA